MADASALATFAARTFADAFSSDNRPEDIRAHLATAYGVAQQTQELNDPAVVTLLAHVAETLIGYAQVRQSPPPPCVNNERPVELHRFYVDRRAHGRGVAQRLMEAVHEAASALGGEHLWLGVWEHNPRAIAFYGKAGFVEVGRTDFFVGRDRQCDRVLVTPVSRGAE